MIKKLVLSALIAGMFSASAIAAGDPNIGKGKAAVCAGCHGADGNGSPSNKTWPKIAGQHASYLAKQLREFKSSSKARIDPTMSAMADGVDDADIEHIAAYYASLDKSSGAADEKLLAVGQKLYRGGDNKRGIAACASCHGPAGNGNPAAKFPAVAGQFAEYAAKTLNDFKSGARANDPGSMMRDVAAKLTADEIKAVASYMAGLK